MLNITLPAHIVFSIGPIPISDGFIGAILVSATLFGFSYFASRKFALIPTRIQMAYEVIMDYIMGLLINAFGDKERAEKFFPFYMTMLLFIVVANQFSLLPFIFEITYNGFDVVRQPTSDLVQPLMFALLIFVISNFMAFKISPLRHLSNFFNIEPLIRARSIPEAFNAIIGLFIGILNIVGEFAKVVSLACRLFGNIFAGNVMVAVIISLAAFTQFIIPIPFIILSIFSGFVQAFVFMLLSIQFVALSIDGAKTPQQKTSPEAVPV